MNVEKGKTTEYCNIASEMLQNMGEHGFEMLIELYNKI